MSFGWLALDFGPDGHIGDPTLATLERGASAYEATIDRLVEAFTEVKHFRYRS